MSSFGFEHPWAFALLGLFLLCARLCPARSEALLYPHLDLFIQSRGRYSYLMPLLKWVAISLTITALASPVLKNRIKMQKRSGYAIVLLIDASGSMQQGFEQSYVGALGPSKFDVTAKLASAFIKKRANDQIGLVVFGNYAYVAAPPTYDTQILTQIVSHLRPRIAGGNYTVINDALYQGAKLLQRSPAKSKIIILLTDGKSRGDTIPSDVALRMITQNGIKVYTVGIGANAKDFDEARLRRIAEASRGAFFHARDERALRRIYTRIDSLEKSELKSRTYIQKSYLYTYPLFFAFLALLLYTYLLNRRGIA